MKKAISRIIILLIVLYVIFLGIAYVYGPYREMSKTRPEGLEYMDKIGAFSMNSETVLPSLNQGNSEVFTQGIIETDINKMDLSQQGPVLYPEILWTSADYWVVARDLDQFVWKDSLDNWNLFSMDFSTTCQENINGFRSSEFVFFKSKLDKGRLSYSWRAISLTPEFGSGIWGEAEYPHPFFGWRKVNMQQLVITAEDALKIAEENGGRDYRTRIQNQCDISVSLQPDSFQGWWVRIWPGGFDINIDPTTGEVIK